VHWRCSKSEARRAEPTFWLCFRVTWQGFTVVVLWGGRRQWSARLLGPSRRLGCAFVERHWKRWMARPEGLSRNLGYDFWELKGQKAKPVAPSWRAHFWWRPTKNAPLSCPRVWTREPLRHAVSTVLLTANPISTFLCTYTVRNCWKIIKMTDFSKTMSRNMRNHAQSVF